MRSKRIDDSVLGRLIACVAGVAVAIGCGSSTDSGEPTEAGGGSGSSSSSSGSPGGSGTSTGSGASSSSSGSTSGGTSSSGSSSSGGATSSSNSSSGSASSSGGKPSSSSSSSSSSGGASSSGGSSGGSSGSTSSSGSSGSSGGADSGLPPAGAGPCDIYASDATPCVAAHSTVRALYGAYTGNLYQVRRASDGTLKDVTPLTPGGFANSALQDSFCAGTTCTISIIYDQSPRANHLTVGPAGGHVPKADNEASATALKLTASGHTVYGVFVSPGIGYRDDKTAGIATADQPEGEYMVTSGVHFNNGCCFDYGNAETNNSDDGAATMEAVYFGNIATMGRGSGNGPWVLADLENGVFSEGVIRGVNANDTPFTTAYVTAMVKGRSGSFALKGGNGQAGTLTTIYDGARPPGYNPMKKQGAIVLGIGGDNSNSSAGSFFEGCMTTGNSTDAVDNAVQANIVAAGYGR